jgi:arylsulfatase A-like enzyme
MLSGPAQGGAEREKSSVIRSPATVRPSAIRSGDWKLVWFWDRAECELYDLRSDLGEQRDLASTKPEMATALRNKLRAFLLESRAMLPVRKDGVAIAMP